MVVIKKGTNRLKVTNSAYKNFYQYAGWVVEEEKTKKKEKPQPEVNNDEVSDEEWDEAMSDDEEPTKPLSEMNRAELEELAKELGVNLAGLSTNKQIREAIKAAM